MSLRDTQSLFYNAISQVAGSDIENSAAAIIKNTGRLSSLKRLDIYRETGLASKIKALQQIYPVCESIIGERVFNNLTHEFAVCNPSFSNDLNIYGELFPEFIDHAVQAQNERSEFSYLQDLCKLEWCWHKVYYQDNDAPFDFEAFTLASQKPDEISLNLSQSLDVFSSNYPVHLIWQQHRDKQAKSLVAGLDSMEYLCIYRQDFIPRIEKITQSHFDLLNACRQGLTLGNMALDKTVSATLHLLPKMIQRGWICGYTHDPRQAEQYV